MVARIEIKLGMYAYYTVSITTDLEKASGNFL